jgi:RNA polymerase sigma-70 factor, ECF subfamily
MNGDCKDDLDLAARVVQGDADAFEAFYARHADLVFAFIYHQLNGARPDAEEVWQDTFVAAIRALPSYRGGSRLSSWLCSVARHKIADYCRRQKRVTQNVSLLPPAELAKLMDEGPLPDEVLNHCAARLRVIEVLGRLPSDYGAALVARYADGHSVEEVARLLSKSYKATESLLSRAREAFRVALSEQPETDL